MKFTIIALIIVFDQISKNIINSYIKINSLIKINDFIKITNIQNTGISFGLLSGKVSQIILIFIISFVISILIIWYKKSINHLEKWGLAIVISGAFGNLIDRIIHGYVIDFIYINYDKYYWPAFNIADIAISVGIVILIIATFVNYKYIKK
jgi:lipoprotein signal peptidase